MNTLQTQFSKLSLDQKEVFALKVAPLLLGLVNDKPMTFTLTPGGNGKKKTRKPVANPAAFRVYKFDLKKMDKEPVRLTNTVTLDSAKKRRKEIASHFTCKWQFVPTMSGSGWYMTENGRYGYVIVDVREQAKMKEHNAFIATIQRELDRLNRTRYGRAGGGR